MNDVTGVSTPDAPVRTWTDRVRSLHPDHLAPGWRLVLSPGTVVGVAYIVLLAVYGRLSHFTRASDYLVIGVPHGTAVGVGNLALGRSTYDAQFAYFMALHPGINGPHWYDNAPIRWSRMLQPLLVRILALGNTDLLPWAFLVINVAAVTLGTAFLAHLLVMQGRSRWLALAYGLYAGVQVAMFRDLADPLAILWLIVALWGLMRNSPLQTAAALGFALLTREAGLLLVPLFFLPLAAQRRWVELIRCGAVALVPFAIWQTALWLWLGKWGLIESGHANGFARLPFSGAFHAYLSPHFGLVVTFVVVPTVLIWIIAATDVAERGLGQSLLEPVALIVLVYSVLFAFQNYDHWNDLWAAGRLLAPAVPFALLLHPRSARQVQASLVTVLLLSGTAITFSVLWG
jgi:hypothetical protein